MGYDDSHKIGVDCSFAIIAANLYSSTFCDILGSDIKETFCTFPRVVLSIDVIVWYVINIVTAHSRVCFCFSLVREILFVIDWHRKSQLQTSTNPVTDKGAEASESHELGERGETKGENA